MCPAERRALKDFYHSVKGAEWTDAENWLSEYELPCNWKGITCNENLTIVGLNLTHNSLSGKLSSSISELRSLEILDLSDNDIQVSEANVNSFYGSFRFNPKCANSHLLYVWFGRELFRKRLDCYYI